MASYNAPILHNGTLNSVVNVSDFTTNNSTSTLNVATADNRYLQLTGGTLSGNLTLPSEYNTGTISTPTITFNANSISQTAGMLGHVLNVSGSVSNFSSASQINPNGISSLPIGVYLLTIQINISNNDASNNLVFSQLAYGCSGINNTTPNTNIYEISNTSFTISPLSIVYFTRTFIYRNGTLGTLNFLFTPTFTGTSSNTLNYSISAMRVA